MTDEEFAQHVRHARTGAAGGNLLMVDPAQYQRLIGEVERLRTLLRDLSDPTEARYRNNDPGTWCIYCEGDYERTSPDLLAHYPYCPILQAQKLVSVENQP